MNLIEEVHVGLAFSGLRARREQKDNNKKIEHGSAFGFLRLLNLHWQERRDRAFHQDAWRDCPNVQSGTKVPRTREL